MSDTPETDKFYEMIEDKCLPIDARYYHMRAHARKMELDTYEQARLLGMSAERECDLRGKLERERALADRLADRLLYHAEVDSEYASDATLAALAAWKEARSE